MDNFKYHSRKFLNKKTGLAAIEVDLSIWEYTAGFDSTIEISDCSRSVRLDFSAYSIDDLAEKYKKLTLLQDEINGLHTYFVDNYEKMADAIKKAEEKRKKENKLAEKK
jgi:hypothetical protein